MLCTLWDPIVFNPLNTELNPICHLLALLGAHHIFHVSGLRVKHDGMYMYMYTSGKTHWTQNRSITALLQQDIAQHQKHVIKMCWKKFTVCGVKTDSCFLRKDGSCENVIFQNVALFRTTAELLRRKGNRKDFKAK